MLKDKLYGIAYGCPRLDRDKDCPFSKIEHFKFKEKVIWIDKFNDDMTNTIWKHHTNCSKVDLSRFYLKNIITINLLYINNEK